MRRLVQILQKIRFGVEFLVQINRALAYVYLPDGSMLNEKLVQAGYAQVATYPPNTKYEGRFLRAQDEASTLARGIWGLNYQDQLLLADQDNGIGGGCVEKPEPTPSSSPTATASPSPAPSPPPDRPAPSPNAPQPPATAPAGPPIGGDKDCEDFDSLAQVQQSIRGGDPYGLDADGDGEACESSF